MRRRRLESELGSAVQQHKLREARPRPWPTATSALAMLNRSRRTRALTAKLLALLLLSVGLFFWLDSPIPAHGETLQQYWQASVYETGDSMSVMAEPYQQYLADIGGRIWQTDAYGGVTLPMCYDWMGKYVTPADAPMPPNVVVACGGNDTEPMFPFMLWIEGTIERLQAGGAQHMLWVNFYAQNPSYPGNNFTNDVAKNQVLAFVASFHPGLVRVLDWASIIARHPEDVGPDGVHYTPAGSALRALSIASNI